MNLDKPSIVFGDKMRAIMGHHTPDATVSEEFKAVLAHELCHIKYSDVHLAKIIPLRLSPWLGAVAGLLGVFYYEHLHKKAENAKKAGMLEAKRIL